MASLIFHSNLNKFYPHIHFVCYLFVFLISIRFLLDLHLNGRRYEINIYLKERFCYCVTISRKLDKWRGCWWHSGSARVSHTATWVRFLHCAVICIKLPLSHVTGVLFSLTLPSIAGFVRVLRFPPVVTLDPWGVALTRPLGRTAYVSDYPV